jgi:hypothetical protein
MELTTLWTIFGRFCHGVWEVKPVRVRYEIHTKSASREGKRKEGKGKNLIHLRLRNGFPFFFASWNFGSQTCSILHGVSGSIALRYLDHSRNARNSFWMCSYCACTFDLLHIRSFAHLIFCSFTILRCASFRSCTLNTYCTCATLVRTCRMYIFLIRTLINAPPRFAHWHCTALHFASSALVEHWTHRHAGPTPLKHPFQSPHRQLSFSSSMCDQLLTRFRRTNSTRSAS